MTATPFRVDNARVLADHAAPFVHSLASHASHPAWCPTDLRVSMEALALADEANEADQRGELTELVQSVDFIEGLVNVWTDRGRPKTVVCLRPNSTSEGGSRGFAERVCERFRTAGGRAFNAVGCDPTIATAFARMVDAERSAGRYEESEWDVLVVMRRGIEGTDWPLCSLVICVGIPNLAGAIQRWGRALRWKGRYADYPAERANRGEIAFVAPRASARTVAGFSANARRNVTYLAAVIAQYECAQLGHDLTSALALSSAKKVDSERPDKEDLLIRALR